MDIFRHLGVFRDRRHPVLIAAGADDDEGLRLRVWLLGLFALTLFAVLTVQLVRLQVFRHDEFEAQATINRIRNTTLPAERGLIFDRNGKPLVENVPAFAISVVPADVPDGEERRIASILAQALGVQAFSIEAKILAGKRSIDPFFPRLLEANAEQALAFELSARGSELPGVEVAAVANRSYAEGALLGHILATWARSRWRSSKSSRPTATASRTGWGRPASRRTTSGCCGGCRASASRRSTRRDASCARCAWKTRRPATASN